jgi:hypothetical protein
VRRVGARAVVALAMAGLSMAAPIVATAQEAAPVAPPWIHDVTLHAFLSTSYSYNFNRPASRTNTLRVFDFDDNTFKLDVFELVAQKEASKPSDAGFRVDVAMGSSVPRVSASAGLFRDDTGTASDIDLQQAYASFIAPLGSGLRIDLGKFVTSFGYEVIEGYDGWNDNATRSLLFGYAIPFTHMGVRAGYTLRPGVSATAMIVNGWDVARDNNRSKSVGAQLALSRGAELTVLVTGMIGPEQTDDDGDVRRLFDVVVSAKPSDRSTVGVEYVFGDEESASDWTGIGGSARVVVSGPFAVAARAEYMEDGGGARTGTRQYLKEVTVTPELRLTPHLLVRADLRRDNSDTSVFEREGRTASQQTTVLLNLIYGF